jgi:hypothetical protein
MDNINVELSMMTNKINGLISFSDYMLSEAIKVIPNVFYGINTPHFNDRKWVQSSYLNFKMDHSTIFLVNGYAYILDIFIVDNKPNIVLRTNPVKYVDESTEQVFKLAAPLRRNRAQSMPYAHVATSFSTAISIALDIGKRQNYHKLKFTAYDPQLLKQFYDKLFSNTIFKNSVSESGWDVSNVDDDFFFVQK